MGMLWTREVLCNHSITGKSSNAFKEKDAKPALDQDKVKSLCGKVLSRWHWENLLIIPRTDYSSPMKDSTRLIELNG